MSPAERTRDGLLDAGERRQAEGQQTQLLTRKSAARDSAQTAEAMFRALLESAPDAISTVDGRGRMVLVNAQMERLFGYRQDELLGQPVELLVPDRLRAAHVAHRLRYAAEPRTRPMGTGLELFGRRKDGSEFPVEISLSSVPTADGLLVIAVIRDVTDRKRLEREKDEFLGNISHDLRTPLAAIMTSIGVVLANEPADVPAPLHRMLVNIELAADRLAELVDNLLELTRLEAGRLQLQPDQLDLRTLVERCARAIEPLAEERGQRLQLELPAEPVLAVIDADRLERAVLNLLSNAHKYGRQGGTIRLSLAPGSDQAVIAVADDGPGIPPTEHGRIFERFYRSTVVADQGKRGSGLGLPIARAMVELHGGRIWVTSEPGAGSTFFVSLPAESV